MVRTVVVKNVSPVRKQTPLLGEIPVRHAIEQLIDGPIESCSDFSKTVVRTQAVSKPSGADLGEHGWRSLLGIDRGLVHPLVGAIHQSYVDHRPLVMSPDMFWLLITQGLARHINQSPEDYREQFGAKPEKERIEIRNDTFCKGAIENPWLDVFSDFATEIQKRIGTRNHSAINAEFSTTGQIEKAAVEIVLMDCVKSYFEYGLVTGCGIPEVILEGEVDDWIHLGRKTRNLGDIFNLSWWTDKLMPIIERITENAAGSSDTGLWRNIYKERDGSGGPFLSGWILMFFPYIGRNDNFSQNPVIVDQKAQSRWLQPDSNLTPDEEPSSTDRRQGRREFDPSLHITTEFLPSGLSKVPFMWKYFSKEFRMELLAGFIGFTQNDQNFALRPKIGWAVREV